MAQAKVMYDFESGGDGEMTVFANENITILRQDVGDGWWEAKNSRGQTGLVPEAYIEIVSAPEPSFPPPPPPAQVQPPRPTSSWNQPQHYPAPNTLSSSWDNNPPPAKPPPPVWQPPAPSNTVVQTNNYSESRGGLKQQQDSYEDWDDDDWDDDDDSVVSGDTDYQGGLGGGTRRDRHGSSSESQRHGTVRKTGLSRFSAFNKQFVESYLFDFSAVSVPQGEKKLVIIDTPDGPAFKPMPEPYTCAIQSPKKETKFRGMKSFIVYQITPTFSGIQVSRRYKHFDWLHERLQEKFPTVAIPPLPEKQISGRFEEDFIQVRQRGLQLWMDRMCKHPAVYQSDVFIHFLTCTDDKKWKTGKRSAEKDQFMSGRLFYTIETPPASLGAQETDQKLEKFSKFIKVMDDSMKHILSLGENNCKKYENTFRKEYRRLGGAFVALSKSFEYDDRPVAQNLTKAVEHTGHTYEEIGQMFGEQPRHDMRHMLEGCQEYKGILSVFPDVMSVPRGLTSKITESSAKYSDTEIAAIQGRADVATYATMAEMNHFQQNRVTDFRSYMEEYLKGQIAFYQQITAKLQDTLSQYQNA